MASGYSRLPVDTDSHVVPSDAPIEGETHTELAPVVLIPRSTNAAATERSSVSPAPVPSEERVPVQAHHGGQPVSDFQPVQQQQQTNVNVVMAQPTSMVSEESPKVPPPNPTLVVLTIVAALILFFFGAIPTWGCIFPSVIFALVGFSLSSSEREDQRQTAKLMNNIACGCNIAALVMFILMVVIIIILTIVYGVNSAEAVNHYHQRIDY